MDSTEPFQSHPTPTPNPANPLWIRPLYNKKHNQNTDLFADLDLLSETQIYSLHLSISIS